MAFRVTVLGSGTILPSRERRATSLLVEASEYVLLFECGPGTLDAVEESGFSFRMLGDIFLTHYHPDHSLGIGHLLAALNVDPVSRYEGKLRLYGPRGLIDLVSRWNALYRSTTPMRDFLELNEIDEATLPFGARTTVRAAPARHGDAPALSYRIDHGERSIVYSGDTSYTESLVELARGVDLLISECSFPDSRAVEGHLSPSTVGRLAAAAAVRHVILVHMYPLFDDGNPLTEVRRHYHGPADIAHDGLEFDLE
jgi:ribonuclease BN (tRNA processing enzyme)